jgi:16S rRNA (guanine966-N2)-methyltransferase
MVRIIAGTHRGRRLVTPESEVVRPSSDRVRTALFNILGTWLEDRDVLDLYAGVGGIGFECLSRGARHVTFVEHNDECCACLRSNAGLLGEFARTTFYSADVAEILGCLVGRRYDLIYADPPYRDAQIVPLLELLARTGVADAESTVVIEHSSKDRMRTGAYTPGWECYRNARHGAAQLSFFNRSDVRAAPDGPALPDRAHATNGQVS